MTDLAQVQQQLDALKEELYNRGILPRPRPQINQGLPTGTAQVIKTSKIRDQWGDTQYVVQFETTCPECKDFQIFGETIPKSCTTEITCRNGHHFNVQLEIGGKSVFSNSAL